MAAWREMPLSFVAYLSAFLMLGLATYFIYTRNQHALALTTSTKAIRFSQALLLMTFQAVLAAPLAVTIHRYILLGEKRGVRGTIWTPITFRFFLWAFGVQFVLFAIEQSDLFLFSSRLLFSFTFLSIGITWIVSVFIAMIFPAIAVGAISTGPIDRLRTSFVQMKGHFWQFVGAVLCALLPVVAPGVAFTWWLQRQALHDMIENGVAGHHPMNALTNGHWFLAICLISSAQTFLVVAAAAAVASWTYASLAPHKER